LLAAQLGLRCILVLRGEKPTGLTANLLLDRIAGADIRYTPVGHYVRNLDSILKDMQAESAAAGQPAWIIPTGASDGYGLYGYIDCAAELKADFQQAEIQPPYIFHATGSGGTQAGLTVGAIKHHLNAEVVGINVCDDEAYFLDKVAADIQHWMELSNDPSSLSDYPITVLDGYVGEGYAKASAEVLQCITDLARSEGVVLDPVYSGKAFYGLCQEIKQGRYADSSDIVFIHTGGVFGLYDFEQQFQHLLD
jgi:D-cysteine desulfhydrase